MRSIDNITKAMFRIAEREGYDLEDEGDILEVARSIMSEYPELGQIFSEDLVAARELSK